ncbi:MAG: hypothetical protein Q9159_007239 [Coniocarpon cinnabarinum]
MVSKDEEYRHSPLTYTTPNATSTPSSQDTTANDHQLNDQPPNDVFGPESTHSIKYKTLTWPTVALLMIAEIVSNGMLSIPSAIATVGLVPGVILIIFLGLFATYTSYLLIQFKLNHPQVHSMGDAGFILFGVVGREIFAFGTFAFAVLGCGSLLFTGQQALSVLSDGKLCGVVYTAIFSGASLLVALPRTFHHLNIASALACVSMLSAGVLAVIGAIAHPTPDRHLRAAQSSSFYTAFLSVTNPVFAYAGHFMFFVLISEMKNPQHAMRSAYTLQGFATSYYVLFSVLTYIYLGPSVGSPSFISLNSGAWKKAAFGAALPNFLVAGGLYAHTAAKLYFVRLFRGRRHLHAHTTLGWGVWIGGVVFCIAVAFVLAVGVPIFNYIVALGASLFASWFTYGVAGFFVLWDLGVRYRGGTREGARRWGGMGEGGVGRWNGEGKGDGQDWDEEKRVEDYVLNSRREVDVRSSNGRLYQWRDATRAWKRHLAQSTLAICTVLAGSFICVAGLYVTIRGIVDAYDTGEVSEPFGCQSDV